MQYLLTSQYFLSFFLTFFSRFSIYLNIFILKYSFCFLLPLFLTCSRLCDPPPLPFSRWKVYCHAIAPSLMLFPIIPYMTIPLALAWRQRSICCSYHSCSKLWWLIEVAIFTGKQDISEKMLIRTTSKYMNSIRLCALPHRPGGHCHHASCEMCPAGTRRAQACMYFIWHLGVCQYNIIGLTLS